VKILFSVAIATPGTVDEVLAKISEVGGKEVTKEQAEEKFIIGMRDFVEQEADDDMVLENVTCSFMNDK
jgi:predicted lactoylglutathione lyase